MFRTPWPGDSRVNIQDDHGPAKAYQVRQVLAAIDKKEGTAMTATSIDITRYSYRVTWSVEDDEYVATGLEFPMSWLAGSQEDALHGLRDAIAEVVDDLVASGEPVPAPLSLRSYSGKFNLRVGGQLHRKLAIEAAQESLSLNQYVVRRLNNAS